MFISYAPAVKFKYLHGDCLLKQCRIYTYLREDKHCQLKAFQIGLGKFH